jgi:uncharacterized membrane protein
MQKDYTQKLEEISRTGFSYSIGSVLEESWALVKKNLGMFIVYALLYLMFAFASNFIPYAGNVLSLLISPAIIAGFVIAARKTDQNQPIDVSTFFEGFSELPKLLPVYLVSLLLTVIGLFLVLLPGIYLAVCYLLIVPLLLYHNGNNGIIETLELMRKAISKNWWLVFGTLIVFGLINIGGLLACGFGLLITIPITFVSYYVLFKQIFGLPEEGPADQEFHELRND